MRDDAVLPLSANTPCPLAATTMRTRSVAALLSAVLTVAAVPGAQPFAPYQDDANPAQWVAGLASPPHPGPPGHLPHDPHHGPHHPKVDDKTIFQALEADERFSRVYKLVNFSDEVTSILNDSSQSVTFFAPPDRALKPPKRHGKHKHHRNTEFDAVGVEAFFSSDVTDTADELELFAALEGFVSDQLLDVNDDDHDDKERKKKIIKAIVTAVLKYHILPAELPAHDLAKNTTYPTALTLHDGSFDGEPLRLRVAQPPRLVKPTLTLNFYANVVFADVKTKNGLIHVVNHPLFPPPSIFTTLFAFSDHFSTLTSAIQRVNFTDAIDWHWVKESKTLEGNPALTLFAPTNAAFHRLPRRLKFFLFSPFGQRALKKILAFHTVPEFVLHTNWVHNASDEDVAIRRNAVSVEDDQFDHIPTAYDFDDFCLLCHSEGGQCDSSDEMVGSHSAFDRFVDPHILAERAFPERDGYGFASGEYDEPEEWIRGAERIVNPRMGTTRCNCAFAGRQCSPPPLPAQFPPPPVPPMRMWVRSPFVGPNGASLPPRCSCSGPPGPPPPHHPPPPPPPPPHHGPFPAPKPVWSVNITLPTLLENHTLAVHVAQFHAILPHKKYSTVLFVNGLPAVAADVPARNGAVHVVSKLISPRKHHHHKHDAEAFVRDPAEAEAQNDKDWEEWEEWLPAWAAED